MNHASSSIARLASWFVVLVVRGDRARFRRAPPRIPICRSRSSLPKSGPRSSRSRCSPAEIQLTTSRDRQSIVVQATFADGITRDVTDEATITPADAKLMRRVGATFLPRGRRRPRLFGRLWRQVGRGAGQGFAGGGADAVELPARCHAGLHAGRLQYGKLPRGGTRQGRISHFALRLRPRRRLFPVDPRDGRAPNQPGGAVGQHPARQGDRSRQPHRRQAIRDHAASSTRRCTAGSRPALPTTTPAKLPKVVGVDLYPQRAVLDGKGSTQQLTARARYSDGTDRDVTSLAVFLTNNDVSAPVSPDGLVTAGSGARRS